MRCHFSPVPLSATLWAIAPQALLSMEFSWQEYMASSRGPSRSRDQTMSPASLALQTDSLLLSHRENPSV